jgi:hypothetical protein
MTCDYIPACIDLLDCLVPPLLTVADDDQVRDPLGLTLIGEGRRRGMVRGEGCLVGQGGEGVGQGGVGVEPF